MKYKNTVLVSVTSAILATSIMYSKTELTGIQSKEDGTDKNLHLIYTEEVDHKGELFSRMENTGIEINDIEVGLKLYENSDEDGVEILDKQVDVYNKYNKEIDRIRSEENRRLRLEKEKIRNSEEGKLIELAHTYKGIPYLWGGENPKVGLDCSAYVRDVYRNMGYRLPRVSKDQAKVGKLVSRRELKPGDLLFFDTRSSRNSSDILTPTEEMENAMNMERGFIPNKVSHVGIYLGEGKMLHASSGKGMIIEDTLGDYYKIRFLHARRIIE